MGLTLILQLQIALFVAFVSLVICLIAILVQRKTLEKYKEMQVKTSRQPIPTPPPQFKSIPAQPTKVSLSPPQNMPLPNLKTINRQPNKSKGVSKNSPLYKELVNLLSGNEEAANRLITRQQQLNPEKSENWILEKVLGDLKRDRRV